VAKSDLDPRLLRIFRAVAEELHFRRAAARLHATPSAVGDGVAELARRVGTQLLRRDRRRVQLTEAGRVMLADAAELLARAGAAAARARDVARGHVGGVTLGLIGAATFEAGPRIVGLVRAAAPGLVLRFREMPARAQIEALREGTLDAGLGRAEARPPGLATRAILRESVVCLLPEGHRLAQQHQLSIAELEGAPVLNLAREQDPAGHDLYLGLHRAAGFEPRVEHEASHVATILFLVATTGCVALGPAGFRVLRREGVVIRPLTSPAPKVETRLVWNPRRVAPALERVLAAVPGQTA
jgi:DNA-binding transcriptional LysR family regulator